MDSRDFPIIEYDDERNAIIKPSRIYPRLDVPDHCLFPFYFKVLERLKKRGILKKITSDKEESFIKSAKEAGVGIAAAWDTFPPNVKDKARTQGLFIRLTFPAFEPEKITWGISRLKEVEDTFL